MLDDQYLIVEDQLAHGFDIGRAFTSHFLRGYQATESLYYRPLITVSYQANYALSGLDPSAYRLTNLLLGVLASLMVFTLTRRLTGSLMAAGLAGAFFAVHPSHAQVIGWISGRTDLISSLFVLAGFLAFASAYRERARFHWPLAVCCSVLYLCALLSKESGAVLPVLCGVYLWVFGPKPRRDELIKWSILAVLPLAIYIVLRHNALGATFDLRESYLLKERLLRVGTVYASYLKSLFTPVETRIFLGNLTRGMSFSSLDLAALAIPPAIVAVAIIARKRLPALAFAAGWILIALLPASDLIPTYTMIPSERFVFLASVGSSMLLGWVVWRLWEYRPPNVHTLPFVAALAALGLAACSASVAISNARDYRSNLDWARLVARSNVQEQGLRLLTAEIFTQNDCAIEAAGEYEAAIGMGWNNIPDERKLQLSCQLGEIYLTSDAPDKAARAFARATRIRSDHAPAWLGLARANLRTDNYAEAVRGFQRAAELAKLSLSDRYELGVALAALGKHDEARAQLVPVIAADPTSELAARARQLISDPGPETRH